MPAAATLDFRAPENNFGFESSSASTSVNPSEHGGFSAGSAAARSGIRSKPRLVKQRKSSKSRSVSSQNVDDAPNFLGSSVARQFQNVGFVFDVSNLDKADESANPVYIDSTGLESSRIRSVGSGYSGSDNIDPGKDDEKEFVGSNDAAFSFGAVSKDQNVNENGEAGKLGLEFELSDEMKKLNIENRQKFSAQADSIQGLHSADLLKDMDQFFVFKRSSKNADESSGSSMPFESEMNATNVGNTSDGFDAQPTNENIFVFGSGVNSARPDVSGFQSQLSGVSIDTDEVKKVIENELPSSFSSRVLTEAHSRKPDPCSRTEDSEVEFVFVFGASSAHFKLPDLDASLTFSVNLANSIGSKVESGLKTRGFKDKSLRKKKGKMIHTNPTKMHTVQKPIFTESKTQDLESSECYSPMDFSPYEDTTSNNDVPLSGHHTIDQANLRNNHSIVVDTESQLNTGFMKSGLGVASSSSNESSSLEQRFAFTASTSVSAQEHVLLHRRQHRKKYTMKKKYISGTNSASQGSTSTLGSQPLFSRPQDQSGNFVASKSTSKHQTEGNKEQEGDSALSAAEKACDKWRRRGNEAYESGELCKAEDFYTRGVNCVPLDDTSGFCMPLVRCYSNRAAPRMALGRVREAIQDCLIAVKLDPTFHRAQIRAANCYLLLGELDDAVQSFEKAMDSSNIVCLDRQVIVSASEGIQKSQKVIKCINRSAELLKLRTSEAATSALESISEAMSISSYSERLLEMKAEALCRLQKHEEAIALCQQTFDIAEKNLIAKATYIHELDDSLSNVRLWRQQTLSKCHFHLGKLEMALDLLEKQESENKAQESPNPFAVTLRDLLKQKSDGNIAFQSGRHAEAVEYYTSAISNSMESRPFASICFCNRAAAHQALGHVADAIADCSFAISLDENYAKAISRRATLHEMIRDYRQAAADLQKLVNLVEKQSQEKSKKSGSENGKELKLVQQRLLMMEEEAKREVPLDFYIILGIKKSDPALEIKKAYHKAALRHHPDKAAQALVRSDVGDDGRTWKDIAELVHMDSDRLFKMIGEAYAVLSDPAKREEYDDEEDLRKVLKENVRTTSRQYSDYYSQAYPFQRSSNRRYWQESFRSYSSSSRRW